MRLSQIKLAGFKSFVDPTHIPLPGQIVGVVGPNGCGKSNVIDALRWVLGESKASALRGETMQDVIFNGSTKRKPVARASVELVFDNSLGKVGGQWVTYAEISIKRVLQRDGGSTYYINQQAVRRKDVTDIFLGTGVGARAYAIIEQGMISRIIEAKPEELRVFLEEAAGVSRYRDRRRETELRLRDTRDNLLRVTDILEELERQRSHLGEQAAVAARFRALEAERVLAQQAFWLLKRDEAGSQRARLGREGEQASLELEAETARLRELESGLEVSRAAQFELADAVHVGQGELYAVNAEVARLEQEIKHAQDQRQRLQQQLGNTRRQIDQQQQQRQSLNTQLEHWLAQQEEAALRVTECEQEAALEDEKLPEAEALARTARESHAALQREHMQLQQQRALAETHRNHATAQLQRQAERRLRLSQERDTLPAVDADEVQAATEAVALLQAEWETQQAQLAEWQVQLPAAESRHRDCQQRVQQLERGHAQTEARLHALQQLQQRLDTDQKLQAWLRRHGLEQAHRLWQGIRIEAGWEDALEAVLRERLNAIDSPADAAMLADPPPAKLVLFQGAEAIPAGTEAPWPSLMARVDCTDPALRPVLQDWLAGVYTLEEEAVAAPLQDLPPGSCFVTPQGHVLTRHGYHFYAPDSVLHGVLARQREIDALQQLLEADGAAMEDGRAELADAEQARQALAAQMAAARQQAAQMQQRLHAEQMQCLRLEQAQERSQGRRAQIEAELADLAAQAEAGGEQQVEAEMQLAELHDSLETIQVQLEDAARQAAAAEQAARAQAARGQAAAQALQEAHFLARTCAGKIADLQQHSRQTVSMLEQFELDLGRLSADLEGGGDGDAGARLQTALEARQVREEALAAARNAQEQANAALRAQEQARLVSAQKLDPLRERLGALALKEQEARLRWEQWDEQLQGVDTAALYTHIESAAVRLSGLQSALGRLEADIAALGAVNLAALEELQAADERKTYLAAQSADLGEAMATLEEAIRRIDKESRDLLMETYNQVNAHLSELFPLLFGGGEARLVLTGEEILDSGVQVMAQPPGKKNSSIHLLSGGEKALTAISLVFSMFKLNPAPFCLLDEVDAPLDDSNTERLCRMIQRMAQQTQFVFISHNKITMEMAQQLVGVTMQEKGVSRVVAVDIEEAMRMRDEPLTA